MTSNRPCTTNSGSCPTPFRVRAMLPSSRDIEWPHHVPNSIMMIILVIIQTHTYMYFPYFLYHYIFLFGYYYMVLVIRMLKFWLTILGIYSIGHEVKVREGATIHLPCLHTAKSSVEIDWFKDKGQNVRHSEGRSIGRMAIQKSQLEINNVRSQDTGNYSCHVKAWQRDQSDSITYTLIVLSKSIHRCIQCAIHLATKVTTQWMGLLHA